jgi:hypothetical protein
MTAARSSPRKRGPSVKNWMSAFAGTNGEEGVWEDWNG